MKNTNPENVGMSSEKLDEIDTILHEFVQTGQIAGIATLIARHGQIVRHSCYGNLHHSNQQPIESNSIFRIASLTKPITSVALLMLWEQGYFDLDDPVSAWLPNFGRFRVLSDAQDLQSASPPQDVGITFRHLLTHTAGLGYGFDDDSEDLLEIAYRRQGLSSTLALPRLPLDQLVEKALQIPLASLPGKTWRYSIAHDVIGHLIGLISGKPFDVFLQENIFMPLKMHDTGFYVPSEKRNRFGPLYGAPTEVGFEVIDGTTESSPYLNVETAPSGGAGLVSTISDYFRFMLMLSNRGTLADIQYLQAETVELMMTNQIDNTTLTPTMGYGLGIGVQKTDKPVYGWIGISGTVAWMFPNHDMIVIAMPQAAFNWDPGNAVVGIAQKAIIA